jgi:hypothetical protein
MYFYKIRTTAILKNYINIIKIYISDKPSNFIITPKHFVYQGYNHNKIIDALFYLCHIEKYIYIERHNFKKTSRIIFKKI